MSISKRIMDAIDWMNVGNYESALIPASIAIDATANRVYSTKSNNQAYKDWLHENLAFITRFMGVSITNSLRFGYSHPDLKLDAEGCCSLEQILYHVVRCGLLHNAGLPKTLRFGPPGIISLQGGNLVLSSELIYGMVAAVIAAPENAELTALDRYVLSIDGQTRRINDLWGKKETFFELFKPDTA